MMRKNLTAGCDHITKSEVVIHHKKSMFVFLFSVIALSLVLSLSLISLSLSTFAVNAQPYSSGSVSSSNNITSSESHVIQMGICVVGAKSPCNGDSNSPK
jgi:hypothetical protein